ncbi:PVC-type heme-binding CxxCH protein [Bythopirellula goksoeyrii]|uniref:Cytochrome c domain-containing protein n=1 Tax=Bythopirellula goksoeyrii TaxID=1400387 RepID=A0A5B9Q1Z1_9BACT|nr:PVC-type heme-binding CxxCH protein [Bythopirellula goksoeyrii]QEG32974.1 hypothetical protein Pr1d_02350 [Bythopirellula goksoeyrii]
MILLRNEFNGCLAWVLLFGLFQPNSGGGEPRCLVDGCKLELVAEEPAIVTPIGVTFDNQGRLLVVESHTHQRGDNYEGPEGDRLRRLSDTDGDGRFDHWQTFAEGFRHAMNVAVRDDDAVYLVTRNDVLLLRDTDGDGKSDKNERVAKIETDIDYPHNGLSGIFIHGDILYLGVGENFGGDYEIVGSDGRRIKNSGGVGTIYRCKLDGSELTRWADGFWNPFSLCMAAGELFCVDNDPDASPPCRLINVLPSGDYGHRFEYGRAGVHPLQAWNGELPGTLPMVCGTGEAPTAILYHRGYLWVTSWGDHRIERYQLTPQKDGTYAAQLTVVVQGDADFRPTGMAVAPDGSIYFADWVDRSYPVHGKGRLWRLELPPEMQTTLAPLNERPEPVPPKLVSLHSKRWNGSILKDELPGILRDALVSSDPEIRLFAVRWIAEERLTELLPDLERLLDEPPPSERYYLAILGAIDWLSREPKQRQQGIADELLVQELENPKRSAETRALALSLSSPDYQHLTPSKLREFLNSDSNELRLAAVRSLADRSTPDRLPVLEEIVNDPEQTLDIRIEALNGLAAEFDEHRNLFEALSTSKNTTLRKEAERILRLRGLGSVFPEEQPSAGDLQAWFDLLAEPGDADSGRRLFFSPVGPQCSVCHRFEGRGGNIGPDLSQVGKQMSRERVITSILDPSREIAPQYQPWILVTDEGQTFVGLRLPKAGDDGLEPYSDTGGKTFVLPSELIAHREPASTSIMPDGLTENLSIQDLRDLVTFLVSEAEAGK